MGEVNAKGIVNDLERERGIFNGIELCQVALLAILFKALESKNENEHLQKYLAGDLRRQIDVADWFELYRKIVAEEESSHRMDGHYVSAYMKGLSHESRYVNAVYRIYCYISDVFSCYERRVWEFTKEILWCMGRKEWMDGAEVTQQSILRVEKMLLGDVSQSTLYDGFCGTALTLIDAAQSGSKLFLQDYNKSVLVIAACLALIRGFCVERLVSTDSLRTKIGLSDQYDRVLLESPLGVKYDRYYMDTILNRHIAYPEEKDAPSVAIRHAIAHLKEDGRGVVLVPASFLYRSDHTENVRNKLLVNGHIDTVVELPKGAWMSTEIKTAFVVVTPRQKRENVLLIDTEKLFERTKDRDLRMKNDGAALLNSIFQGKKEIEGISKVVSVAEIIQGEKGLSAGKYIISQQPYPKEIDIKGMVKKMRVEIEELYQVEKELQEMRRTWFE